MKTAIQQLISELENFKTFPMLGNKEMHAVEACIEFANVAMEDEKQQIIDAHSQGIKFMALNTKVPNPISEYYYNQTYNQ